nr:flavodoxin family protein [Clostridia bacterium]
MKVLIFNGSPRKGNTMTAIKAIQKGIASRADAADIEVDVIVAEGKNIIPCRACNACGCMSRCIFADDSPEINAAVEAADVLIFATPVYWWGMT